MLDQHNIKSYLLKKKFLDKTPPKELDMNTRLDLKLAKYRSDVLHDSTDQMEEKCLGSVHQYINPDKQREPFWTFCKNRIVHDDRKRYDMGEAERILLDNSKQKEEKIMASKIIAQTMLRNIYGEKLKKIEQDQRQKENSRPKNLINLSSLQVVMNQMQYNPRSQSIMLRKEELERLREFGRQQKSKKTLGKMAIDEDSMIEVIYRLKNQYSSLKSIIIPTKSQEYEYFLSFYNQKNQNRGEQHEKSATGSSFFKTMFADLKMAKPRDEEFIRQDQYFEKFKAYKNSSSVVKHLPSRFIQTDQELVLQNIMQMKPPIFMFVLNQCHFAKLRFIKLKYIKISEDLLLLFLDCLRTMAAEIGCIQTFQLSSIIVQNRLRFSEKLSLLLREVSVKNLKLDSMDLCTSEFNRIAYGMLENKQIEEISLRHNRIDILGVRNMEVISKKLSKLKMLDVRNNDIPHYANLKDKSPLILFF